MTLADEIAEIDAEIDRTMPERLSPAQKLALDAFAICDELMGDFALRLRAPSCPLHARAPRREAWDQRCPTCALIRCQTVARLRASK